MNYLETVKRTNQQIETINNNFDLFKKEQTTKKNKLKKDILRNELIVYSLVFISYSILMFLFI